MYKQPPIPSDSDPENGTRKLAAIVFIDIKDFSTRFAKDNAVAMAALENYNGLVLDFSRRFGGNVIKTVQGTYLLSFESVVSSVQFSIALQQSFLECNENMPDSAQISPRIGIHLGDIFFKDNDVFGDGVNIAARIHTQPGPGGIAISDSVYQQVRNKLEIHVIDLGVPQLKGISLAVHLYQIIVIPSDTSRSLLGTRLFVLRTLLLRQRTKRMVLFAVIALAVLIPLWFYVLAPTPPPNSLAVLPFRAIGDSANEYIVDGFTEDLVAGLSDLKGLHVLSKGSTFDLKNSAKSERDLAKELGVYCLLTGSIEVNRENLVVKMRLTEPLEGRDVWNLYITRKREELLYVKHEALRKIAVLFQTVVQPASKSKTSAEVYDLYLRGLDYDRRQRKEDNQIAISCFQSAVDKDSSFVDASLALASCELLNYELQYDLEQKWLIKADENTHRAFRLDSTQAEVYALLGRLSVARGKRTEGIGFLEKSVQINPNLVSSYFFLGKEYLQNLNEPGKAVRYFAKAQELEPTDFNAAMNVGVAYAYMKDYPEAIKAFKSASVLNPTEDRPLFDLGYAYERMGMLDSAEAAYRTALAGNPIDADAAAHIAPFLIRSKKFQQVDSILIASLRYAPSNYALLYYLGISRFSNGNADSGRIVWKNGLRFAEVGMTENPTLSQHFLYAGLFSARLGRIQKAIQYCQKAIVRDSSDDNVLGMSRIYAIAGKEKDMVEWFARARTMNSEYDDLYLATDIDFQKYLNDGDLLFVARK